MKTVTAAEVSRHFSALLRDVAQGERVLVTLRGKLVATIEPVRLRLRTVVSAAKRSLLARLDSLPVSGQTRDWTRDELDD